MIKPEDGYIVAEKAKDNSNGFEVDLPGYRDDATGEIVYTTHYDLQVGDKFIINKDSVIAREVSDAN